MPAVRVTEQIEWIPITDSFPDEGELVMVYVPAANEPVWFGWLEGVNEFGPVWCYVDGTTVEHDVTHWTNGPAGPEGGRDRDAD